ncbi:MAG TPA: hypothetical protein VFR09_04570, partial [Alphaproteobacteria bacterium]|nr:hypothetical protein [Alphaproteobacteria bacterium]
MADNTFRQTAAAQNDVFTDVDSHTPKLAIHFHAALNGAHIRLVHNEQLVGAFLPVNDWEIY